MSISRIAENEGLSKIVELINKCCVFFEECKTFHSYKYHVDILVRTHLPVKISLDSKDRWIAEIDVTAGYDEKINWCFAWMNTKQFSFIFTTTYDKEVISMNI